MIGKSWRARPKAYGPGIQTYIDTGGFRNSSTRPSHRACIETQIDCRQTNMRCLDEKAQMPQSWLGGPLMVLRHQALRVMRIPLYKDTVLKTTDVYSNHPK